MGLSERPDGSGPARVVGLCGTCRHAETVTSVRGSIFCVCRLSASDPRFPKYPPLPVMVCEGYVSVQRCAGRGDGAPLS